MYEKKRRILSFNDLLGKAMKYCAYQERCIFDLKQKLYQWNAQKNFSEKIIDTLIDEGFIDERRFTEVYVKGKINIKKWGKIKIRASLKLKKIPEEIIDSNLNKIPQDKYIENIKSITAKKIIELESEKDPNLKKQKVFRHLASKGYETECITEIINTL